MTIISNYITNVMSGKMNLKNIPANVLAQVQHGMTIRQKRHVGRFTTKNNDGTTTCGNGTLTVTLPTDEFNEIGRCGVFDAAMRKLGNDCEAELLKSEPVTDDKIKKEAREIAIYRYLSRHGRYNLAETIMRRNGGHMMSEGMAADITAAEYYAINNTSDEDMSEARDSLNMQRDLDLRYRNRTKTWCAGWKIEIIGKMPKQIGLCRYTAKY